MDLAANRERWLTISTVPVIKLGKRIGALTDIEMLEVTLALAVFLGLAS